MRRKTLSQTRRHANVKRSHKKVMQRQRKLYIQETSASVETDPLANIHY